MTPIPDSNIKPLRALRVRHKAGSDLQGIWKSYTVVCIASGPSLTLEDCEAVRGLKTIVCNTSFRIAPWADVLYAMDAVWWKVYIHEVDKTYPGIKASCADLEHWFGVYRLRDCGFIKSNNTGAGAISLAAYMGARRIIMLGYDLSHDGEKAHHHGDHPAPLGNARNQSIKGWLPQFEKLRARLNESGIEISNCSRRTALDWPRSTIEDELERFRAGKVSGDMDAA